jgi:hypothetical protein
MTSTQKGCVDDQAHENQSYFDNFQSLAGSQVVWQLCDVDCLLPCVGLHLCGTGQGDLADAFDLDRLPFHIKQ